jgi:hypothetical protein
MDHLLEPSTEEMPLWLPEAGLIETARRLAELEEAVRSHEEAASSPAVPKRPGDHALYRRVKSTMPLPRPQSNGG